MSAKNGAGSDDGRRDAGDEGPFGPITPIERRLAQAAAWCNVATLAEGACAACERRALDEAFKATRKSLAEIEERISRSEKAHGPTPEHAKAPIVLVLDSEDEDFVASTMHLPH